MKNITIRTGIISLTLLLVLSITTPLCAQKATKKFVITDKETGVQRSKGSFYVRSNSLDEEIAQVVMGFGDDDIYQQARFLKKSLLKNDSYWMQQKTEVFYYYKKDKVGGGYLIEYDYEKHEVFFTRLGKDKKKQSQETYDIKGPICDAINLPVFLERFLAHHERLTYTYFYLLSTEPKLYKVNIYYRGVEQIDIDGEKIQAKKIQLIGDMGPLTELAAKFLPKTYVWFTAEKPYRWLKYEGLERGRDSAHIVVQVTDKK